MLGLTACSSGGDPAELFREGEFERAYELFSERAADGDLDAINHLGIHYFLGAGVERDFGQAAKYFEQAALANHADAQRNLGIMYMRGHGVKLDNRRAYGWFFHAHTGGNRTARAYLRVLGDNVTPNAGAAARDAVAELLREHAAGAAVSGAAP
ncbi:MAG: tetratricopeptide repeat protein [Gammaproteobacteria bacterium]